MRRIVNVALIAVILVVFGAGMVFAGGEAQKGKSQAPTEWKWTRKITIISPWGPGGGIGPAIRNLLPELEKIVGVPCEVQHVEGAGGLTGTVFAQRQPADGYIFVAGTQSTVGLDIRKQLGFDFREEFIPVGKLVHATKGIIASKKATQGLFSDFKGFLDYVKAHPGQLSVGMRSPGGSDEVSLIECMALALKVSIADARKYLKVVPFASGAEQDAALVGGHVHCTVQGLNESPGLIESGDINPLIVFSEQRMKSYPNVPSTGEMGIAAYIGTWRGIFARKGTPPAAIAAMEKAMEKAWYTDSYQKFCAQEGYLERKGYEGQVDFKKLVDDEYVSMTEFMKAAGLIK